MGRNQRPLSNLSPMSAEYLIDTVHTWGQEETLAWVNDFHIAVAAYETAIAKMPENKILLRHRARVMRKHNWPD